MKTLAKVALIVKVRKDDIWYNDRDLFENRKMEQGRDGFFRFINKRDIQRAKKRGYSNSVGFLFLDNSKFRWF